MDETKWLGLVGCGALVLLFLVGAFEAARQSARNKARESQVQHHEQVEQSGAPDIKPVQVHLLYSNGERVVYQLEQPTGQ